MNSFGHAPRKQRSATINDYMLASVNQFKPQSHNPLLILVLPFSPTYLKYIPTVP